MLHAKYFEIGVGKLKNKMFHQIGFLNHHYKLKLSLVENHRATIFHQFLEAHRSKSARNRPCQLRKDARSSFSVYRLIDGIAILRSNSNTIHTNICIVSPNTSQVGYVYPSLMHTYRSWVFNFWYVLWSSSPLHSD